MKQYNRYNDDGDCIEFQLLLKGCTIEAFRSIANALGFKFQLLLKGCTIEAQSEEVRFLLRCIPFQLLLKGCTIEALSKERSNFVPVFQLLLKGCTIEAVFNFVDISAAKKVSVVVERMYD